MFRADRDGQSDVWLSQIGTGRFVNLTQGREEEALLPVRSVGFSGDGSEIWIAGFVPVQRLRLMPLTGGTPRPFLRDHTVNVAWSPDGTRVVFHTGDPGDQMFVADRTGSNAQQIFELGPGGHNHHPTWSPDGQWIYFVSGIWDTKEMDLWRIAPSGGKPERLTQHRADVRYVAPLDNQRVIYVAPDQDGSGPWLWALDVGRQVTRSVSSGLERYTSVAASADGRRMVATVANPSSSLWSLPISDRVVDEGDVSPFPLPASRALAPRFGGRSLFYLSSSGGAGDGLWRQQEGQALEIWKGADGPLLVPPAVSPDGSRVVLVLRREGKLRSHIGAADGTEFRPLTEAIDVRGAAGWSPDGKFVVTGGSDEMGAGLFKIPVDGGAPVRLLSGPAFNPVWSPDGALIVYTGPTVGPSAPLLAARPDGTPVELPSIRVQFNGERHRFSPDGRSLIYMQGQSPWQDFWLLDLATKKSRLLTRLNTRAAMRTFDITPDGKQIVFDRLRDNSDIVLIDLAKL